MIRMTVIEGYLLRAVNSGANVWEDDEVTTLSKEDNEHPDCIASKNRSHELDSNTDKYLNGQDDEVDSLKVQLV